MPPRPGVPVCTAVEHHAVLDPVRALDGAVVEVDRSGRVDLDSVGRGAGGRRTTRLGRLGHARQQRDGRRQRPGRGRPGRPGPRARGPPGAPAHRCGAGRRMARPAHMHAASADLVSISAHKLGGPKGIGALVVRQHTPIRPLVMGGGQEHGRRSGTSNVAGIVGLAAALDATVAHRVATNERIAALRDRLAEGLLDRAAGTVETAVPDGDRSAVLPGICHLCIDGVDSESLLFLLEAEGVAASAASSCASGAQQSSHVLEAMGVDPLVAADRCACRSGGTPPRMTSTPRSPRCHGRSNGSGRSDEGSPDEGPRRAVGRRGLVGRGRVAARGGPRGRRGHDELWGGASDTGCCSVVRRRGRSPGRRAARRGPPRVQLRATTSSARSSTRTSPITWRAARRTRAWSATAT